MKFIDQLNRVIQLQKTPKSIVSLVPSLTELICDLGLKTWLVGVTKFCVHPKSIREEAVIVGGTKQVHFNKIQDLNPDIILCNKEENTIEMIQELEKIAPVHISDINSVLDCHELIEMYGKIFNVQSQSNFIIESLIKEQLDFEFFVKDKPMQSVAYFIWKEPWMAVGNETFIDYMLSVNRFKNFFNKQSRYPEIDLINEYPDVKYVFLSSEPYPFKTSHAEELQANFPNAKIVLVNGEMFSWYGSRLIKAFSYFKKLNNELNNAKLN